MCLIPGYHPNKGPRSGYGLKILYAFSNLPKGIYRSFYFSVMSYELHKWYKPHNPTKFIITKDGKYPSGFHIYTEKPSSQVLKALGTVVAVVKYEHAHTEGYDISLTAPITTKTIVARRMMLLSVFNNLNDAMKELENLRN